MTTEQQMASWITALERRVADLERAAQRRQAVIYAGTHGATGTTSGTNVSVIASVTIPRTFVAGTVVVLGHAYLTFSAAGDQFEVYVDVDAAGQVFGVSDRINTNASRLDAMVHPIGEFANDGSADHTYALSVVRGAGAGTASFFGTDPRYGLVHAIFIPS